MLSVILLVLVKLSVLLLQPSTCHVILTGDLRLLTLLLPLPLTRARPPLPFAYCWLCFLPFHMRCCRLRYTDTCALAQALQVLPISLPINCPQLHGRGTTLSHQS